MLVQLDDDDFQYALKRQIRTPHRQFVHDQYTESKFSDAQFFDESLNSVALESGVARRLGLARKAVDDTGPDLPGAEVASVSESNWSGRPYFHSRWIGKPGQPKSYRFFLPTLTGFRVPTRKGIYQLRYFIEPEMLDAIRLRDAHPKSSGITRWLVDRVTASNLGADVDVWFRLERAVRAAQVRLQQATQGHQQLSSATASVEP